MSLTTNLISYWKLDESSGNAADSVGSNTLTNTSTTFGACKINNGGIFDGSTSKLLNSSPSGLPTGDATRTVSFWMYPTNVSTTNGTPFNFGTTNQARKDTYHTYNSANGKFNVSTSGEAYDLNTTFSVNTWYHMVIVNTTGSNIVKVYVNGSLDTTATFVNGSLNTTIGGLSVGCDTNSASFFYGKIDEVGIWSRALSSTEVTQLYNSGNGLQYPFTSTNNSGFFNFF